MMDFLTRCQEYVKHELENLQSNELCSLLNRKYDLNLHQHDKVRALIISLAFSFMLDHTLFLNMPYTYKLWFYKPFRATFSFFMVFACRIQHKL